MATDSGRSLDELLDLIKESRGFDFTGYKRSSIERRVAKRMSDVGVERYEDYLDYLELHAGEFAELFNTLLINVSGFFRDPQTWEHLATQILPQLLTRVGPDSPIRVWCAGCAGGEEAYTVAMVLARVLGDAAFRDRVKIYATDIDEEALDTARHGAYLPRQIEGVPQAALERFFERTDQRYVFRKDLRRSVIFGRNDLVQDAPISRIDLLFCRNTLMYFTAETQSRILRRFHFALDDEGFLVLGKSEMLVTHAELFTPVDLKRRVFRKAIKPALRDRARILAPAPGDGASQTVAEHLREAAFELASVPQVVLDTSDTLVMANGSARRMFGLGVPDYGRPVQDLELSYRPVELRAHLDVMAREPRTIEIAAVRWTRGERERVSNIQVTPLRGDGGVLGTSITFADVTDTHLLRNEISNSKHELEQAYEELQATVEELETTNEELMSTNEELETTNEELQSANQELETMNEELQSGNEELETMNAELRHRGVELNEMNAFLETILTTVGLAVAVLDGRQHVQIWNGQARDLWGLSPEDAEDQHFLALDFGLPVERLRQPLTLLLNDGSVREELVLDATNRLGKAIQCRVTILPLHADNDGDGSGVVVMMKPLS
jgi:two-component system CheB/CheR fusion protein